MKKFVVGQRVRKTKGSEWQGIIVGEYSTTLTPEGYAVESEAHLGSVQIYPVGALELVPSLRDEPVAWVSSVDRDRIITHLGRRTINEVDQNVKFLPLVHSSEHEKLLTLVRECADYLNTNEHTAIQHGSVLHRSLEAALGDPL